MRYAFTSTAVIALIAVAAAAPAHAQTPDLATASIQILPSAPGPLERVQAELRTFSYDLERSTITWTVNGQVVGKGVGARRINVSTGPLGTATEIKVDFIDPFGKVGSATHVVRPAHVGIAWEANTYTPPFYKGKALHSPGSVLTLIAVPILINAAGAELPADELIYTWYRDNRELRDISGVGRQIVVLQNDAFLRPMNMAVKVSSFDGSITARGEALIAVAHPVVNFYEHHPLLGVRYERALQGSVSLPGAEMSVIAEPYHFASASRSDRNLEYEWTVDRQPVSAKGLLTLRPVGNGGGRSSIQLALRHIAHLLQTTRSTLAITFAGQ